MQISTIRWSWSLSASYQWWSVGMLCQVRWDAVYASGAPAALVCRMGKRNKNFPRTPNAADAPYRSDNVKWWHPPIFIGSNVSGNHYYHVDMSIYTCILLSRTMADGIGTDLDGSTIYFCCVSCKWRNNTSTCNYCSVLCRCASVKTCPLHHSREAHHVTRQQATAPYTSPDRRPLSLLAPTYVL